ncbi:hypothetical protein Ciccas_009831 [Cichlidogyrus casuarinus]|uniref:Fibronectin type-III domain-containing protein n=1 Tax=Cichlidogyrus casuarinus TaxID=1844966 RepID=A0ABD2PWD4_9PLAT
MVGTDEGSVLLTEPSLPDMPTRLDALNSTATTVGIRWAQGYNGGPKQVFVLRWAKNESPNHSNEIEVPEQEDSISMDYVIRGLTKATTYRVSVASKNELYGSHGFTDYVLATTADRDPVKTGIGEAENAMGDQPLKKGGFGSADNDPLGQSGFNNGSTSSHPFTIILAASIFGAFVFFANLMLVACVIKRRRDKSRLDKVHHLGMSAHMLSKSDGLELCTNPSLTGHQFSNHGDYLLGTPLGYTVGTPIANSSDMLSNGFYTQNPDAVSAKGCVNMMLGMKTPTLAKQYGHGPSSLDGSLEPMLQGVEPMEGSYQGPQDAGLSSRPESGASNAFNYSSLQYQNHMLNQNRQMKFMNDIERVDFNSSGVRPVLVMPDMYRNRPSPARESNKIHYSQLAPPSRQHSGLPSPKSGSPVNQRNSQLIVTPNIGRFPMISPSLGMRAMTTSYHVASQNLGGNAAFSSNEGKIPSDLYLANGIFRNNKECVGRI